MYFSPKITILGSAGDLDDLVFYNQFRKKHKLQKRPAYLGLYATINGYHIYRVRPEVEKPLSLVREPENEYDFNAIKVMDISTSPITMIGRMPRRCSKVIAEYMDNGTITHSCAFYKGKMEFGTSELFGLGPKLVCMYFFEVQSIEAKNILKSRLLEEMNKLEIFIR